MVVANQKTCVCGKTYWPRQAWDHRGCVANESVPNPVANVVANQSVEYLRVKLWREANRERYNASQKEVMREYRKRKRAKSV